MFENLKKLAAPTGAKAAPLSKVAPDLFSDEQMEKLAGALSWGLRLVGVKVPEGPIMNVFVTGEAFASAVIVAVGEFQKGHSAK